jgi:hypothetical protein
MLAFLFHHHFQPLILNIYLGFGGIINLCVMQVSAVGVTGARSNVNLRVEHLLREIKKVSKYNLFVISKQK